MEIGSFGFTALALMMVEPNQDNFRKYVSYFNNPVDSICFGQLLLEISYLEELFDGLDTIYYRETSDGGFTSDPMWSRIERAELKVDEATTEEERAKAQKRLDAIPQEKRDEFAQLKSMGIAEKLPSNVQDTEEQLSGDAHKMLLTIYRKRGNLEWIKEILQQHSLVEDVGKVFGVNLYRLVHYKPTTLYYKSEEMLTNLLEDVAVEEISKDLELVKDYIVYSNSPKEVRQEEETKVSLLAEKFGERNFGIFEDSAFEEVVEKKDITEETRKLLYLIYADLYHLTHSEKVLEGIFGLGLSVQEYQKIMQELDENLGLVGLHRNLHLYFTEMINSRLLQTYTKVEFPAVQSDGSKGFAFVSNNLTRLLESHKVEVGGEI